MDNLRNSLTQSTDDMIANGFLAFSRRHPFIRKCIRALTAGYNPKDYGQNGPVLMRNTFVRWCNASSAEEVVGLVCGGVKLFPRKYFLPLNHTQWLKFFRTEHEREVWDALKSSYLMHVYGSKSFQVAAEPRSAYAMAAEMNCPITFALSMKMQGYF